MQSLKNAMRWMNRCYGREYDLDLYMIVAVGHFNMGAMENKGLNVFNTKFVLAALIPRLTPIMSILKALSVMNIFITGREIALPVETGFSSA